MDIYSCLFLQCKSYPLLWVSAIILMFISTLYNKILYLVHLLSTAGARVLKKPTEIFPFFIDGHSTMLLQEHASRGKIGKFELFLFSVLTVSYRSSSKCE